MSSFFIGPPDKQIFAVLSEPRQQSENNTLVVLCYPFGQEYMRAHRAYRQLANLLARSGFTTLRFDYPACGDSYGDVPLESVSELMADLQRVVDTVQGRTQATRVYVVGLRFGALIAAKIAEQMPAVNGLFLWDSYASGADFIADCTKQAASQVPSSHEPGPGETWSVHGFPLAAHFRDSIAKFDIRNCSFSSAMKLHHIISHENVASRALHQHFGVRLNQKLILSNGDWNYVDMEGSILMPTALISTLSKTITGA